MRVAVASDGSQVSPHFGRCERYVLADVESGEVTSLTALDNPGHEPGVLPALLHSHGVEVVIAGGMGPRAVGLFHDNGIEPVVGVSGPVDEVLARFVAGQLEVGPSLSDH